MRNKIDNILIGVLWLLAATLGTCFWFNIAFGFNIFSGAHWQHLAYMQAAQTPVKISFYISMVAAVFITLFVLYLLIKPRHRNIHLPHHMRAPVAPPARPAQSVTAPAAPAQAPTPQTQPVSNTIDTAPRPPRLNISIPSGNHNGTAPTALVASSMNPQTTVQRDWPEVTKIFSDAGYVIKPNPRINGMQTILCAIGMNETLWLGAAGVETTKMSNAIDKLNQVFADTLDDIYINVHGFVISAPDAGNSDSNILTFSDTTQLHEYMLSHKNPPLPADEQENFDAYSDYISTVIDYIGKI